MNPWTVLLAISPPLDNDWRLTIKRDAGGNNKNPYVRSNRRIIFRRYYVLSTHSKVIALSKFMCTLTYIISRSQHKEIINEEISIDNIWYEFFRSRPKIWKNILIDDSTNYERFYLSQSKPIIRGQVLRGFR